MREDALFAVEYLRKKGYQAAAESNGENLCGEHEALNTTHSSPTTTVTSHAQTRGFPFFPRARISIPTPIPAHVAVSASGSYMCVWGTRMNELELVKAGSQGPRPL